MVTVGSPIFLKLPIYHFTILQLSERKPGRKWTKRLEQANCALMHLFFCWESIIHQALFPYVSENFVSKITMTFWSGKGSVKHPFNFCTRQLFINFKGLHKSLLPASLTGQGKDSSHVTEWFTEHQGGLFSACWIIHSLAEVKWMCAVRTHTCRSMRWMVSLEWSASFKDRRNDVYVLCAVHEL